MSKKLLLIVLLCAGIHAVGQQLVLLRGENVILRLNPGDEIVLKVKGEDRIRRSYVNNVYPYAVKLHRDTIPFHHIERIYFKRARFYNRIGEVLVMLGSGYFLLDQVNTALVQGNGFGLDRRVTRTTVAALSVGLPLALIRSRSQKLTHKYRLRTVDERSLLYRPDR